jgi:hypothetical protein
MFGNSGSRGIEMHAGVWSRVLTRTEWPESLAFCSGEVTAAATWS